MSRFKVKGKRFMAVLFMLSFVMTMMLGVSASAAEPDNGGISDGDAWAYVTDNPNSFIGKGLTTDPSAGTNLAFVVGGTTYYFESGQSKDTLTATAKTIINSSAVGDKVNDITGNLGVGADIEGATVGLAGFVPLVNMFLGIAVVVVTLGLAVFTAFDVCYICFPVFRNKCEDMKVNGGPGVKHGANGEVKLRFVSDEAQYAVNNSATIESGKSPLTTYLAKRIWAYIAVSIILFMFFTGQINIITEIAMGVVKFIMEALSSLT